MATATSATGASSSASASQHPAEPLADSESHAIALQTYHTPEVEEASPPSPPSTSAPPPIRFPLSYWNPFRTRPHIEIVNGVIVRNEPAPVSAPRWRSDSTIRIAALVSCITGIGSFLLALWQTILQQIQIQSPSQTSNHTKRHEDYLASQRREKPSLTAYLRNRCASAYRSIKRTIEKGLALLEDGPSYQRVRRNVHTLDSLV